MTRDVVAMLTQVLDLVPEVSGDAAEVVKRAKWMVDRAPAVVRLGLDQRLVKSWRLSEVGRDRDPYPAIGLYVDRATGLFYARVPETDEGTLYAAETLIALSDQVHEARAHWVESLREADEEHQDTRAWERRIVIHYSGADSSPSRWRIGQVVNGEPTNIAGRGWRPTPWQDPHDVAPCVIPGVLTYARYERAPQPGGKVYDVREWGEDFDARMAAWERDDLRRLTVEQHRSSRPRRGRGWKKYPVEGNSRDLPWDPDVWERLRVMAGQFQQLDAALLAFLVEEPDATFLQQLELRALPGPVTTRESCG